jgi:hypothetical protein
MTACLDSPWACSDNGVIVVGGGAVYLSSVRGPVNCSSSNGCRVIASAHMGGDRPVTSCGYLSTAPLCSLTALGIRFRPVSS